MNSIRLPDSLDISYYIMGCWDKLGNYPEYILYHIFNINSLGCWCIKNRLFTDKGIRYFAR